MAEFSTRATPVPAFEARAAVDPGFFPAPHGAPWMRWGRPEYAYDDDVPVVVKQRAEQAVIETVLRFLAEPHHSEWCRDLYRVTIW